MRFIARVDNTAIIGRGARDFLTDIVRPLRNRIARAVPLVLDDFAQTVSDLLAEQTEKTVVLWADEKVPHGNFIKIMDLLRQKGIYKIIISTQKP